MVDQHCDRREETARSVDIRARVQGGYGADLVKAISGEARVSGFEGLMDVIRNYPVTISSFCSIDGRDAGYSLPLERGRSSWVAASVFRLSRQSRNVLIPAK